MPISVEGTGEARVLRLQLPDAKMRDLVNAEQERLVSIIGVPLVQGARASLVDVGARWIMAELDSAKTVLNLTPDMAASAVFEAALSVTGVTVFARHLSGDGIEVRSFAPSCGVNEDPVCGSGNGSVAAYRLARGQITDALNYTATQGRCVGRSGQVHITTNAGRIYVGGQAITTVDGKLTST